MTITKEQVDAWDGEVKAAYQSGYNAGAEAKLAELADRERMLTDKELADPQYMKAYIEGCNETIAETLKYSKALTAERDALKSELDKCVAAARAALEATK